ncbi:MAG: hypothetical protein BA867_05075 [Desulfobacterales bacterium S5133MH16]|nr:MAG: hypothetical protein BA867_05075 [Desulfobacterales bacterium S5133MH16]
MVKLLNLFPDFYIELLKKYQFSKTKSSLPVQSKPFEKQACLNTRMMAKWSKNDHDSIHAIMAMVLFLPTF